MNFAIAGMANGALSINAVLPIVLQQNFAARRGFGEVLLKPGRAKGEPVMRRFLITLAMVCAIGAVIIWMAAPRRNSIPGAAAPAHQEGASGGEVTPDDESTSRDEIKSFIGELKVEQSGNLAVYEQVILNVHGPALSHGWERVLSRPSSGSAPDYRIRLATDKAGQAFFPHSLKSDGYHVLLGFGKEKLAPGEHPFSLQYDVGAYPLRRGKSGTLRWEVTGVLPVPLRYVEFVLRLPRSVERSTIRYAAWIDHPAVLDTTPALAADFRDDGSLAFRTLRVLIPGESLIIEVQWPESSGGR